MSAFGGKADIFQGVAECPLIAKSGHSATRVGDPKSYKIELLRKTHLRLLGELHKLGGHLGPRKKGGRPCSKIAFCLQYIKDGKACIGWIFMDAY